MTGYCENCKKRNECRKQIGIIWGFCNTDFEPETEQIETVDRGLWCYELRGERAKEAAEDLEGRYDRLDRLAACTPFDLNYQDEMGGWIAEIENKYNVIIKKY